MYVTWKSGAKQTEFLEETTKLNRYHQLRKDGIIELKIKPKLYTVL